MTLDQALEWANENCDRKSGNAKLAEARAVVDKLAAEASNMRTALRVIHIWACTAGALDERHVRDLTADVLHMEKTK